MATTNVVILNASTVVTDAEVQAAVPALQAQVHNDFAPAWGIDANLTFVPRGADPAPGSWWLVILDDSDQAAGVGVHDITHEGMPLGKVFARTDLQTGHHWTVTASHELLEMLVDPAINLAVFVQPDTQSWILYAYEVCDACEGDQFGYEIGGTLVSDFVYPAWFEVFRKEGTTQMDHGRNIQKPLQLLPGGYISVFDGESGIGWHQLRAEDTPKAYRLRPRVGSRRERRRTPRDEWQGSFVWWK